MLKRYEREPAALTRAFTEAQRSSGLHGNARGKHHEARLLMVIEIHFRARWYVKARRATKREDQSGIDIVVESSIGPLYVQVKSSPGAAREFSYRRRRARITVVVVNERFTDLEILKNVGQKLHSLFKHIVDLRRGRRRRNTHTSPHG